MTTLPDLEPAEMTDAEIERWAEVCNHDPARNALRHYIALRRAARSAPEAGKAVVKVQHRVRPHKKAEWGPWTDGYVPKDYLGWFEQREVPTEIGWRDKRIEILTDECVRRSKQISEIAKQRNDAEIRAETAEAEATSLRRKLEEAERERDDWKATHGRVVQGFAEVCEAVGVQFDAPDAVAYAINAKIGNAEHDLRAAERKLEDAERKLAEAAAHE